MIKHTDFELTALLQNLPVVRMEWDKGVAKLIWRTPPTPQQQNRAEAIILAEEPGVSFNHSS